MKESATERHVGAHAEQRKKENPNANPGIDAEVEAAVGERKGGSRYGGDNETKGLRDFLASFWAKIREPTAPSHQCFTMALKPASSRPFLAASAAFGSA